MGYLDRQTYVAKVTITRRGVWVSVEAESLEEAKKLFEEGRWDSEDDDGEMVDWEVSCVALY